MQNQMSGMNISGNQAGYSGMEGYNAAQQQPNMAAQNMGQPTQPSQPQHNWGAPSGQTLSTNLWQ